MTALRAGRDDPLVQHPQDACDSPRAAARRSLNTPRPRPRVPRRTQFLAVPDAHAEPEPVTELEWHAKPEWNYDVHRIGNG